MLADRVLLNELHFVPLKLQCQRVVNRCNVISNFLLSQKAFNHLLSCLFLLLKFLTYLLLKGCFADVGELAHCFVEHGQELVCLKIQVNLQFVY